MVFKVSKIGRVWRWRLAASVISYCFVPLLLSPSSLFARTHHYTSFSDRPELFLKAIEDYKRSPHTKCKGNKETIRGGIITHHFLANWMMVDFFECLASQVKPDRIILIGPDHFHKGINSVSTSSLPWKTPFGKLDANVSTVNNIKEALGLNSDYEAFSGEHSIGIVVPFIRYYFPKSRIVPVLVQKQVPRHMLLRFTRLLNQYQSDPKTLILLSMDFSHNQTSTEADRRDEVSKEAILGLKFDQVDKLDVDSPAGLFLLLSAMKEANVYIRHHSNSSKITGKKDIKNVTSYFTMFFTSKARP